MSFQLIHFWIENSKIRIKYLDIRIIRIKLFGIRMNYSVFGK